jgi:RHS repeat-associated protein
VTSTKLENKRVGREYDDETGLHNFRARIYDSVLMRFYQVDPAEQFASPYIYCGDNPIQYVDPDGREIQVDIDLQTIVCHSVRAEMTQFIEFGKESTLNWQLLQKQYLLQQRKEPHYIDKVTEALITIGQSKQILRMLILPNYYDEKARIVKFQNPKVNLEGPAGLTYNSEDTEFSSKIGLTHLRNGKDVIIINPYLSEAQQAWTIGHELGHELAKIKKIDPNHQYLPRLPHKTEFDTNLQLRDIYENLQKNAWQNYMDNR